MSADTADPSSPAVAEPDLPAALAPSRPMAYFDGMLATDLVEVVDLTADPDAIERGGWWALVATFEGALTAYRFADVRRSPLPVSAPPADPVGGQSQLGQGRLEPGGLGPGRLEPGWHGPGWHGPDLGAWRTSLDRAQYLAGVSTIRERIAAGDVYQVNLCRMLSAPLPVAADPLALAARLAAGNPAPYQGVLHTGRDWVVTASPELFLSRSGSLVVSSPVKGTTGPGEPFADKDYPENIMITDLVRNDLGRVAEAGTVKVTRLVEREEHPGLAHLVSTVQAHLRRGVDWQALLAATLPPGSVSGAPKHTALQVISELEPVPRGPYCGAIGYLDADRGTAVLAVGIRTLFTSDGPAGERLLNFGTGAGITYASDPEAEWAETELKAARLIRLASG
jgi:para-aminobenzoate synthetase component 1